jgi:hypothetical protein
MSFNNLRYTVFSTSICLLIFLPSCNMPGYRGEETPTQNVTQAYQTVNAKLTSAALETKPATSQLLPTESGVNTTPPTPKQTNSPGAPIYTATEPVKTVEIPCDLGMAGIPIDVTIPDDTVMAPGNTFTKIWRIKNAGNCTWTTTYAVAFFSGEQMSAKGTGNYAMQNKNSLVLVQMGIQRFGCGYRSLQPPHRHLPHLHQPALLPPRQPHLSFKPMELLTYSPGNSLI